MYDKKGSLAALSVILMFVVGALGILAIGAESLFGRLLAISFLVLILVVGVGYIYYELTSQKARLRQKLSALLRSIEHETVDDLHEAYLEVHDLYSRLHEQHKSHFYDKMTEAMERIEEKLQAEKRMQELLPTSMSGSLDAQRAHYAEMYEHYLKLPTKLKEKYYPHLVALRQRLEKGA